MLFATEGIEKDEDLSKPMVGVASVWSVNFIRCVRWDVKSYAVLIVKGMKATRQFKVSLQLPR